MKNSEIAAALSVSPGRVSQLKAKGMPADTVEGAKAWYARNVDPVRSMGQSLSRADRHRAAPPDPPRPAAPVSPPPGWDRVASTLQTVRDLVEIIQPMVGTPGFEDAALALRAVLRKVPPAARCLVEMEWSLWVALCRDVLAVARPEVDWHSPKPRMESASMSPDDEVASGLFWYEVAAGEVRVAEPTR